MSMPDFRSPLPPLPPSLPPSQVNKVLEIGFKTYIRLVACFPEKVTRVLFSSTSSGLEFSEKVCHALTPTQVVNISLHSLPLSLPPTLSSSSSSPLPPSPTGTCKHYSGRIQDAGRTDLWLACSHAFHEMNPHQVSSCHGLVTTIRS